MAKIETYKCDNCGAVKGEANHWWIMYRRGQLEEIVLLRWNGNQTGDGLMHLCGEKCVLAKASEFMGGAK